jgi:serine protease inhibitor
MKTQWMALVLGSGALLTILGGSLAWKLQVKAELFPMQQADNPIAMNYPNQPLIADASAVDLQLVEAQTDFGFVLFEQLRQTTPDSNVLISPASVAIALTMAYNGAGGETQGEMAEVLRIQGVEIDQVNRATQALQHHLMALDPEVELAIANSLWVNEQLPVHATYMDLVEHTFDALITPLDFTDSAAKDQINDWVSEQTNDRIPSIVDQIPPEQLLFLINAVYFKGSWADAFDESLTEELPFRLVNGTEIQHPRMRQSGEYRYLETDQFQAISLPYGSGALSFEVLLPREEVDLDAFYGQLTPETWQSWMNQMRSRNGQIELPRFQFAYEADLIDALTAMGMGSAFAIDQADFSGMTSLEAAINQVKHKTYIDVNEEGTEAAAVTSIGIVTTSMPVEPEPLFQMTVDRPFFAAIRDRETGTILFMGSIMDPR